MAATGEGGGSGEARAGGEARSGPTRLGRAGRGLCGPAVAPEEREEAQGQVAAPDWTGGGAGHVRFGTDVSGGAEEVGSRV